MATTTRKRSIQAASDYVPGENDGETWIRRFKDPVTQIRICPMERTNARGETVYGTDAWPTTREHYSDDAGSFPCDASIGGSEEECDGCQDEDSKVNQRRRQYYINAVDDQGEYRVFKMGAKLYKTFQAREQRMRSNDPDNLQPLSDRDYLINRMGKGLDTTYDPEAGDKYEYDFDVDKLHDIDQILLDRAEAAHRIYMGEDPTEANAGDEDEKPAAKKAAAKKAAPAAKKTAAKKAAPKPEPEESAEFDPATEDDIDEADTGDIRNYLDAHDVEYPSRAPRSRLVTIAKEYLAENPPY